MSTIINDREGRALVGAGASIEQIGHGFGFTEGPVWRTAADDLVFSDIVGDQMWRWEARSGLSSFRRPSRMANGNALDPEGRLVTCEHATSRLVREEPDGSLSVLASHHEGLELNSPNDVIVGSDGVIWFSDPTYGRSAGFGVAREPLLGFRGVFRLDPAGHLQVAADDFAQPNGLCFSLDGTSLYVNDTDRMHIRRFGVGADGRLSGGEVWAELAGEGPGGPDGMKLDSLGNVWCTGPGGIHAFAPDATLLGVVETPEVVGNFAWGGPDLQSLFICATSGLYRLSTGVAGHVPAWQVPRAAD